MEVGSNPAGTKWLVRVALATAVMAVIGLFGESAETAAIQAGQARPAAIEV